MTIDDFFCEKSTLLDMSIHMIDSVINLFCDSQCRDLWYPRDQIPRTSKKLSEMLVDLSFVELNFMVEIFFNL